MVVVLAAAQQGLVERGAGPHVDALDESTVGEQVEHPVDAGNPHRAAVRTQSVEDLLSRETAVLGAEQLDHGAARAAGAQARPVERREGLLRPRRGLHAPQTISVLNAFFRSAG